jgi:hypothetical protein
MEFSRIEDADDDTRTNTKVLNEPPITHPPFTKTAEETRREIDKLSLEFLLNKKLYKKVIGNSGVCAQSARETEERRQYIIKYRGELLKLFNGLLDDNSYGSGSDVNVSHEIQHIFGSFVDKSVNYFIRMKQMLNPVDYEKDEDDDDDDAKSCEDEDDAKRDESKKDRFNKLFNNQIYGKKREPLYRTDKKSGGSHWGDDVVMDDD